MVICILYSILCAHCLRTRTDVRRLSRRSNNNNQLLFINNIEVLAYG